MRTPPVIAIGGAALGCGMAALAGLGAAAALVGGGWVWPHGQATTGHVIGGLLTGHPGRGLPPTQADKVSGPVAVHTAVAVRELFMLTRS